MQLPNPMDIGEAHNRIPFPLIIVFFALFWGFFFHSCIPRKYLAVEDSNGFHDHIKLKFRFEGRDEKQNGKILMQFDRDNVKMLFLSLFNQVYYELYIQKKQAWLVNTRGRKYWRGNFDRLINEMWNIDIGIEELRSLILEGIVPKEKKRHPELNISLEYDGDFGRPRNIKITNGEIQLWLKIQSRALKSGGIRFHPDFDKLRQADIQTVLNSY